MIAWIYLGLVGLCWLVVSLPGLRLTVLFDGSCPMCRRTWAVLRGLNWATSLRGLSFREADELEARFPDLQLVDLERDMHVVDRQGRVFRGFRAYQAMVWRLPLLAPLAWLLWLPPVSTIGKRVYRRVADQRVVEGCGTETCEIEPGSIRRS